MAAQEAWPFGELLGKVFYIRVEDRNTLRAYSIGKYCRNFYYEVLFYRMRPVSMPISGGGNNSGNRTESLSVSENSVVDYPIADPIFVKNRYGREDLLALLSKDVHPPDGLDKCQFYVVTAQKPIVLTPLSDTETRLQHNINSSKAMSLLSHADRATIASGGMIGGSSIPIQLRTSQENRSFSPMWISPSGGNNGFGRGNIQLGRTTFGGSYRGRGVTQTSSSNPSDPPVIGRLSASRLNRTGIPGFGRGSCTTHTTQPFNARAQGLYDPRDPRDRPRQRLRSTSDDGSNPPFGNTVDDSASTLNSGWTQVGRAAAPWNKRTHVGTNTTIQQPAANAEFTSQSQLPEWMSDDRERGDNSNLEETGSFDDRGQFQTSKFAQRMTTSLDLMQNPASNVPVDIPERQRSHQEEEKPTLTSSLPVNVPSAWSMLPSNLEQPQPQPNRIAKPFVEVYGVTEHSVAEFAHFAGKKPDTSMALSSEQAASVAATTAAVVNSPFRQNYADDVSLLSHATSIGLASRSDYVDEWFYVDPKNAVQGPFPTIHMQAWYKLGYFTSDLRVRYGQNSDNSFMTLGELITMNGDETPFKLKPLPPPVMQLPLQQTQEVSRNIWSRDYNVSLIEAAKVKKERQKLEEEQRRVAEQERQLKEMREALLKEEEERLERERRIMEKELQLQRAQEELAQLAAEEKERAAAREREIEAEKKRLAEEMERTKKEEVERALAETRRKEEEKDQQRLKAEAERRIKETKELKKRQETEEIARKTTAEQERIRRQVAVSESTAPREKENLHQKSAEFKKGTAAKEFVVTEEFAPSLKQKSENTSDNWPYSWQVTCQQSGEEKVVAPKTAPWVAVANKGTADRSEPSLLDIQQEEERQMIAAMRHRRQVNGAAVWKDANEAARAGVWSSATHKLRWKQDSQPASEATVVPSRQVAWGGAKGMNNITASKTVWDDTSPSDGSRSKANNKNTRSANKSERGNTEHEAMKKIFKQSVTSTGNALSSWMINRVKQLNPQVDADVFAAFIEGVDNPNEVEDYIIGYLGESRLVKDLIREFLERRSQARQKREPVDKDDLTHPAQAADALSTTAANTKSDNSTSQQVLTGGGKRKKKGNKGNKLVVDGACLGFKGAVDPNRVNVGEIDTVGGGVL
uniref:GYF domain-containing protein n=1 Tax=Setaria digitata TaxID=48799 RepID=A0A915Q3H9_9BILA